MDKIYLKCSFYQSEQEIEMYEELPIYRATNIREDIIVFEDACYSGKVKLDKKDKDVQKITVLLNESNIGNVRLEDTDMSEGTIQFNEQIAGIAQPFLLQCDLVMLGLEIKYVDGSIRHLYSSYLLCASKNEDDNNNTENMLNELLLYDNDKVNSWIFGNKEANDIQNGLVEGAMRAKSYRSVTTYIQMLRQVSECYRKYYLYFKKSAKHNVIPIPKRIDYKQARKLGQRDINWLFKNLEQLFPVDIDTSIESGGINYLPLRIMTEHRQINFMVYENEIIMSFLKTIIGEAQQIFTELQRAIVTAEDIYNRLRITPPKGYFAPIITVKQIQNKYLRTVQNDLKFIVSELRKIYQMYYGILPIKGEALSYLPRKTKVFQEIQAYSKVYDLIVKWFEFGEISLEREKIIFRVKTIDKLYEYYCLQQILKMLLDEDFVIRDANNDIRCIEYKVGDNKYKNEVDVANTYVLYRNEEKVVVYYQPVIYSDGYSNGLNLYRTTKKNSYYSPDFVLKFSRGKDEKYVVLDSKYANRNSIIKYRLRECIWNYGVEVEAREETAGVEMMWLLQGRRDDSAAIYTLSNSPNAQKCKHTRSYGIISINTKDNNRKRLWNEILKAI